MLARLAGEHGPRMAQHGPRVVDDVYCNQPYCDQVLPQRLNSTYRPTDSQALYEEIAAHRVDDVQERWERRWTGQYHEIWRYRYVNDVPLRASLDALKVHWCELTIVREDTGGRRYHKAFESNHWRMREGGRGREGWSGAVEKENENNNVLKI